MIGVWLHVFILFYSLLNNIYKGFFTSSLFAGFSLINKNAIGSCSGTRIKMSAVISGTKYILTKFEEE